MTDQEELTGQQETIQSQGLSSFKQKWQLAVIVFLLLISCAEASTEDLAPFTPAAIETVTPLASAPGEASSLAILATATTIPSLTAIPAATSLPPPLSTHTPLPVDASAPTSTLAPLWIPPALPGWVWLHREWAGYAYMWPQPWSYDARYADDAYKSPETASLIFVSTKPYAAQIEANSAWHGYPAQLEVDEGGGGSPFEVILTIVGDNRTFSLHYHSTSRWSEVELQIFRTMIETFVVRGAAKEGVNIPIDWETEKSPTAYSIVATAQEVVSEAGVLVLAEPVQGFVTITLAEGGQLLTESGMAATWEDVIPGTQVQATGEVGEAGTLLTQEITLLTAPVSGENFEEF